MFQFLFEIFQFEYQPDYYRGEKEYGEELNKKSIKFFYILINLHIGIMMIVIKTQSTIVNHGSRREK